MGRNCLNAQQRYTLINNQSFNFWGILHRLLQGFEGGRRNSRTSFSRRGMAPNEGTTTAPAQREVSLVLNTIGVFLQPLIESFVVLMDRATPALAGRPPSTSSRRCRITSCPACCLTRCRKRILLLSRSKKWSQRTGTQLRTCWQSWTGAPGERTC